MGTDPDGAIMLRADGLVAVGVNTARQWGLHHDWSRGRINLRQLAAIMAAFDAASEDDLAWSSRTTRFC